MKKLFLSLLFLFGSFFGYSQHFDLGLGVGTGSAYLFENYDASVDINYSLSFNGYVRLQYIPAASFFNLNLNFQYINTGISGRNWKNDKTINGEVSSLTTSFLLEHLKENKTWIFGYAFGPGYTVENYSENLLYEQPEEARRYMSFTASGIASVAVSKVLRVRMEPTVLWTDPVNALRPSNYWHIAGDDVSFLLQVGIDYRFRLSVSDLSGHPPQPIRDLTGCFNSITPRPSFHYSLTPSLHHSITPSLLHLKSITVPILLFFFI